MLSTRQAGASTLLSLVKKSKNNLVEIDAIRRRGNAASGETYIRSKPVAAGRSPTRDSHNLEFAVVPNAGTDHRTAGRGEQVPLAGHCPD
jgi:hypothetical protein